MLLARLAVSIPWQGRRIGSCLLRDAILRTLQAADIVGIRAFAVHAKDESAQKNCPSLLPSTGLHCFAGRTGPRPETDTYLNIFIKLTKYCNHTVKRKSLELRVTNA